MAIGYAVTAQSADHTDSPAVTADPTADIADVYVFMNGPNDVIFAMTLYPNAPSGAQFSDGVAYVLHTSSATTFGTPTSNVDITATFSTAQAISLWVGQSEFVTGNAGDPTGLTTPDGKVTVFAGLRADPFFFNLDGFHATLADIIDAGPLPANDAGCPTLPAPTAAALVAQLGSSPDGGPARNNFANSNALAIVVRVDKSLVTRGGPLISVWGATYQIGLADAAAEEADR